MNDILVDQKVRENVQSDLRTSFIVEAGAGTGKTTLTISRLLALIKSGVRISRVIAITFTEKAAAELRERIQRRLQEFPGEPWACEALEELPTSHIETIHAFCAWLLREFPLEAGIDPNHRVLDQIDSNLLWTDVWADWFTRALDKPPRILEKVVRSGISISDIEGLAECLRANRVRFGIPSKSSAHNDGGELFQEHRKSWQRSSQRIREILGNCLDENDALAKRLNWWQNWIQENDGLDDEKWMAALASCLPPVIRGGKKGSWSSAESMEGAKILLDELKEKPGLGELILRPLANWLRNAIEEYDQCKMKRGLVDFDDLLLQSALLLRNHPSVRSQLQSRFDVVVVDEFQDTDPLQAEMLMWLCQKPGDMASSWDSVEITPGKLMIVGDPKQSIYRFRRADIEIYTKTKRLLLRNGSSVAITRSFRTISPIIDWVNRIFEKLIQAPAHGTYQPNYFALHPIPEHQIDGSHVIRLIENSPQDRDAAGHRSMEAVSVAKLIRQMVNNPEYQGREGNLNWGDFAVLLPTYNGVEPYEEAFDDAGIPYVVEGGKDFYQRPEIRTLCSLLLTLDDPENLKELVSSLRSDLFGIPDEGIFLYSTSQPLKYLETPQQPCEPFNMFQVMTRLKQWHGVRHQMSLTAYVIYLMDQSSIREIFGQLSHGAQKLANLAKVVELIRRYEAAGVQSLRKLVDFIRNHALSKVEESQAGITENRKDAVQILTIHKSKGLEWECVVLGDLRTQIRKSEKVIWFNEAPEAKCGQWTTRSFLEATQHEFQRLDAERIRCLYVASTRPRSWLILPWIGGEPQKTCWRQYFSKVFESDPMTDLMRDLSVELLADSPPISDEKQQQDKAPWSVQNLLKQREEWLQQKTESVQRLLSGLRKLKPSAHDQVDHSERNDLIIDKELELSDIQGLSPLKGKDLGIQTHTFLEKWDFGSLEKLTNDQNQIRQLLLKSSGNAIWQRLQMAEKIHREVPIVWNSPEGLVEGFMDVLFRENGDWFLLDYKTDEIRHEDELNERLAFYRSQIRVYAEAVRAVTGVEIKEKYLFFLKLNKLVTVN